MTRKPDDETIRRRWRRIVRYAHGAPPGIAHDASRRFRLRMGAVLADQLEAEGVTDADLVRLGLVEDPAP